MGVKGYEHRGLLIAVGVPAYSSSLAASELADPTIPFTRSSMYFPALNVTAFRDGTITASPVFGFRAFRGFRTFTSYTPKFRSSSRPSVTSTSVMPSSVNWTIRFTSVCGMSIRFAISDTMSFFVMLWFLSILTYVEANHPCRFSSLYRRARPDANSEDTR